MQLKFDVAIVFLALTAVSDAGFPCEQVLTEKITAMTSDGTDCDVYTQSKDFEGWMWYQCYLTGNRIKDGVPRTVTVSTERARDPNQFPIGHKLKPFLEEEGLLLIDFFTIERNRIKDPLNPKEHLPEQVVEKEVVAMVVHQNRLRGIWYNETKLKYQFQDKFERMNFPPKFMDQFTGVTRIKNYSLFSFNDPKSTEPHRVFVVKDSEGENGRAANYSLPAMNAEAITYLGKSRHGADLLGVADTVTQSQIMKMYELSPGMGPRKLYDIRPISTFIGCPQDMCLEGGIDSIYSMSKSADDRTIYVTRGQFLYKLDKMGGQIEAILIGSNNYNYYDCEASFALYDPLTKSQHHYHVVNGENLVFRLEYDNYDGDTSGGIFIADRKVKNDLFRNVIPEKDEIFASLHINQYNHSNEQLILFAGDKMYTFNYTFIPTGISFQFIKNTTINKVFDNIWKTFDSAFYDPINNCIYIFNRDYHVKYEWKEDGMMTPMSDPVLNQGTIWSCDESKLVGKYKMFNGTFDTFDEYSSEIIKKYRYESLPGSGSPKEKVTRKMKNNSKNSTWMYVVIGVLIVIISLIIIALVFVCRDKNQTPSVANSRYKQSTKGPKKVEQSFMSIPSRTSTAIKSRTSQDKLSKSKIIK